MSTRRIRYLNIRLECGREISDEFGSDERLSLFVRFELRTRWRYTTKMKNTASERGKERVTREL